MYYIQTGADTIKKHAVLHRYQLGRNFLRIRFELHWAFFCAASKLSPQHETLFIISTSGGGGGGRGARINLYILFQYWFCFKTQPKCHWLVKNFFPTRVRTQDTKNMGQLL